MHKVDKGLPVPVDVNATQVQQRFGPLWNPTHAAVIEALAENVLNSSLDRARSEFQGAIK